MSDAPKTTDACKAPDPTKARHDHELSQLRQFQALSLRSKLEAVEGMADVVRRFEEMRRDGKFRSK